MSDINLAVAIAGMQMQNPVMTASGTFGFGTEYGEYVDRNRLGALVLKTVTKGPREGNDPPRIVETPAGILNSIGLANPGVEAFLKFNLPEIAGIRVPVIASIGGETPDEYAFLAEKFEACGEIAAVEVNISCPNVNRGGIEFGISSELVGEVVARIRAATSLPLIVKLSPNVTDIVKIAAAAVENGADALALINTLLGMKIDTAKKKPTLGNKMGGLSGPAVRPVAVRMVWQVYRALKVPIVGVGGISNTEDALEFIMAGACAVAVGTQNFVRPATAVEIAAGLHTFCEQERVRDINELVGIAAD